LVAFAASVRHVLWRVARVELSEGVDPSMADSVKT
jgi:hypothetical protein